MLIDKSEYPNTSLIKQDILYCEQCHIPMRSYFQLRKFVFARRNGKHSIFPNERRESHFIVNQLFLFQKSYFACMMRTGHCAQYYRKFFIAVDRFRDANFERTFPLY